MYIKQARWKINHFSEAYLLSNICTKNYWNGITIAKIMQMNLVNSFWQVRLPTKQVFKVVSETGENCKLFDKCIINNIPQLRLLARS